MKPFYLFCPGSWIKHITIVMLFPVTTMCVTTASAGEALVISLGSIPERIRKQNPDLAAARYRIAEARGRLNQSGLHSNPELGINVTLDPAFRERSLHVSIARKFPLTNRLALEKSVSASALKAAEAEVLDVERRLIASAKQLLIKVFAIRKQRELLKQQESLANQLSEHITESAKKGEGSVLDAGQAKLEAAQFRNQLRQLNAESAILSGQLKPLLGMGTSESLLINGDLPGITKPGRSTDPGKRPDLRAAKLKANAAAKTADLERAKSRDDIELSISAGIERTEDAPEGYDSESLFGVGIRIPLPLSNKNEGAIQEADARKQRMEQEVKALAHKIRHQASTAHAEMTEWAKISEEISGNLLPLARQQAKLAINAYHEGQGNLQIALRAREQVLNLSSARLQAVRDFNLAKIRYEAALAK